VLVISTTIPGSAGMNLNNINILEKVAVDQGNIDEYPDKPQFL
jgi:hypothetical protein